MNRRAKSVQVSLSPKGVLRTSMYLEWPISQAETMCTGDVDDEMNTEAVIKVPPVGAVGTTPRTTASTARVTIVDRLVFAAWSTMRYTPRDHRQADMAGSSKLIKDGLYLVTLYIFESRGSKMYRTSGQCWARPCCSELPGNSRLVAACLPAAAECLVPCCSHCASTFACRRRSALGT